MLLVFDRFIYLLARLDALSAVSRGLVACLLPPRFLCMRAPLLIDSGRLITPRWVFFFGMLSVGSGQVVRGGCWELVCFFVVFDAENEVREDRTDRRRGGEIDVEKKHQSSLWFVFRCTMMMSTLSRIIRGFKVLRAANSTKHPIGSESGMCLFVECTRLPDAPLDLHLYIMRFVRRISLLSCAAFVYHVRTGKPMIVSWVVRG